MAAWLVENMIWLGAAIVVLAVGSKIILGGWLKRLMDESERAE